MTAADDRLARLEERLEALEAENRRLMNEHRVSSRNTTGDEPVSRRAMLGKLGAVAAAGAGATLLQATPANASRADGENLVWGENTGADQVVLQAFGTSPSSVFKVVQPPQRTGGGILSLRLDAVSRYFQHTNSAISGDNPDSGAGVRGTSERGWGLFGLGSGGVRGEGGVGVSGKSEAGYGVEGTSTSGDGVHGRSGTAGFIVPYVAGVRGESTDAFGVIGTSTNGLGLYGVSTGNHAIKGQRGENPSGVNPGPYSGVWGDSTDAVGVLGTSKDNSGVFGASTNQSGVLGTSTVSAGVEGKSSGGDGVLGHYTGTGSGRGVSGIVSGAGVGATGVSGVVSDAGAAAGTVAVSGINFSTSANGIGVEGRHSGRGAGVSGTATNGPGLRATGTDGGRLLISPRPNAGAPLTGQFSVGEIICDADTQLFINTDPFSGATGIWTRIFSEVPHARGWGGATYMVNMPYRLYDSRTPAQGGVGGTGGILGGNGKIPAMGNRDIKVAGTQPGGPSEDIFVPDGAIGAIGTITVTQTEGGGGFLVLSPGGSATRPPTSNVNWFGTNQNIAASFVAPLNRTTGEIRVGAGGTATHFVIDITGFII